MTALLTETVLSKRAINGKIATAAITLPAGCSSGVLTCPNIDAADLTDPTKLLQIDVEFSLDGINWEHDVGSGLWQGNPDAVPPGGWGTGIDPRFAGALVRAWIDDFGSGVNTDILAEIF